MKKYLKMIAMVSVFALILSAFNVPFAGRAQAAGKKYLVLVEKKEGSFTALADAVKVSGSKITVDSKAVKKALGEKTSKKDGFVAANTLKKVAKYTYINTNAKSASAYKKLGYAGVIIYSKVAARYDAPELTAVKNLDDIAEDKPLTFYVVRHGQTFFNTKSIAQGWTDSPLTATGVTQAQNFGLGLKDAGIKFTAAYCSTSERSVDTAENALLYSGNDITAKHCKDLREMNYGTLEGGPGSALFMKEDGSFDASRFVTGWTDVEGESWDQLGERAVGVLKQAAEENKKLGGNILISTHGMTVMAICMQLDPEAWQTESSKEGFGGIGNCAVTVFEYKDGKFTMKSFNDESYRDNGEKLR